MSESWITVDITKRKIYQIYKSMAGQQRRQYKTRPS